jgi:hypothetical protein
VPETPINKHRKAGRLEYKIGISQDVLGMGAPPPNLAFFQQRDKSFLCRLIAR